MFLTRRHADPDHTTKYERAHHHSLRDEYPLTIYHLRPAHKGTAATFNFFGFWIVETVPSI
jgi:hypothetical protein